MKKMIVLNHKMNLDYEEALDYVDKIDGKISDDFNLVILPSFPYLSLFKKLSYQIGAQNVYCFDKGSYTGEVSPLQLKMMGITYALVGHSERRIHFNEDDQLINMKIKAALKNNMKVILCIGETDEEKHLKRTALILKKQVTSALKDIDADELKDITIAYEPVWAIGTGVTPKEEEVQDAITYIKKMVKENCNVNMQVLYGGSITKENIRIFFNVATCDGLLIGTSSINPDYLIAMLDLID